MYLWILVPKTVALNIERIASCLWSTVKELIFPLDASKRVEMAMWTANEIASDDCVQLFSGPQRTFLVRDIHLLTQISSNPLSQFGRQPPQDLVFCTVCVRDVLLSRIQTVILNNIGGHTWRDGIQWINSKPGWLQKVNVNILLSTLSTQIADSLPDRKRQIIS